MTLEEYQEGSSQEQNITASSKLANLALVVPYLILTIDSCATQLRDLRMEVDEGC